MSDWMSAYFIIERLSCFYFLALSVAMRASSFV